MLDHMDVGELRKKVLDGERRGEDEKEWLIRVLMRKEGLGPKGLEMVEVKQEDGGDIGVVRAKRGQESEETIAARKRVKAD